MTHFGIRNLRDHSVDAVRQRFDYAVGGHGLSSSWIDTVASGQPRDRDRLSGERR